jgi:hypothetical protein
MYAWIANVFCRDADYLEPKPFPLIVFYIDNLLFI